MTYLDRYAVFVAEWSVRGRAAAAGALVAAGTVAEGILASGGVWLQLTWVQPASESICIIALGAVAYLCLERHRARQAPLAWRAGLVFVAAAILNLFAVLTFPDLVGDAAIIGTNPSTSAYFFAVQYMVMGGGTVLALWSTRWRRVAHTPGQQAFELGSALVLTLAYAIPIMIASEAGALPALVENGAFTDARTWLNRIAAVLLTAAAGSLLPSTASSRPWLSRPLLFCLAILISATLAAEFPLQRYDPGWYGLRVLRPLAFGVVFIGVLNEYANLYRDERRRAEVQAALADAAGELAALRSPEEITQALGRRLRGIAGGDRSVVIFLLVQGAAEPTVTPAFAEGGVAEAILGVGPRPADVGIIGHVLRTGGAYATADPDDPVGVAVPGAPDRPGAVLAVPLVAERPLGVAIRTRSAHVPYSALEVGGAMLFAQQAAAALQRAYQAETVDRLKNDFVSLVSHELRTPLTSIKGYVELLLEGEVGEITEEQREFLGIVKANADREVALINDLLDISRMEEGRIELLRRPVDAGEAARAAVASLRPQLERKGQQVEVVADGGVPAVLADPARLTQILTNLLSNAHKYTPAGGHISVRVRGEHSLVAIQVADSGIGLTEEEQDRVFEKFFRAKNRATEEVGGTGLGLAITKQLVQLHGGSIHVTSAPGNGSVFTVRLPAAPVR